MEGDVVIPLNGGYVVLRKKGSMVIPEQSGSQRVVNWDDHVRVTSQYGESKLSVPFVRALLTLSQNKDYCSWVDHL